MNILIDNKSGVPIYDQIYSQIKSQIINGSLNEDDMLPSIRGLAKDLRISFITTKRAYEELEKEGLIRSVAGKGFYVCEYNTDYLREKQLMMIEERFGEIIDDCKKAGLTVEDVVEMVETLYKE